MFEYLSQWTLWDKEFRLYDLRVMGFVVRVREDGLKVKLVKVYSLFPIASVAEEALIVWIYRNSEGRPEFIYLRNIELIKLSPVPVAKSFEAMICPSLVS